MTRQETKISILYLRFPGIVAQLQAQRFTSYSEPFSQFDYLFVIYHDAGMILEVLDFFPLFGAACGVSCFR